MIVITEYVLVCQQDYAAFKKRMNEKLKDGWQPYGNFTLDTIGNYYQPMVKYGYLSNHDSMCKHEWSEKWQNCNRCGDPAPEGLFSTFPK